MVSLLIVALLLAMLQVAVYVHVRNVVTASAQLGARYAANADVDSASGAARTVEVVAQATTVQTAEGLACTSGEQVDSSGSTLVRGGHRRTRRVRGRRGELRRDLGRVHADAGARGGVLRVRDGDRADPVPPGVRRRQHGDRPVRRRTRPLRR